MLHLAAKIAEQAHAGQTDKTGNPYIDHCRRVAETVEGLDEKVVAYLHDVLEKGEDWTSEKLLGEGFSGFIIEAVLAMTKRPDEDDASFVRRAASNPLALPVKRADLQDNLRQTLQAGLPTEKYEKGLRILDEEFPSRST